MATSRKPAGKAAPKSAAPKSTAAKKTATSKAAPKSAAAKKPAAKKAAPRSAVPKRPLDDTPAPRRTAPKAVAAKKAAPKNAPKAAATSRATDMADEGATGANPAVEGYFAAQAPDKRVLLEQLRALVDDGVPGAQVSIKWGVPFYQRNGRNVCALAAFKQHVAINFFAPPATLEDPAGRLEGGGPNNRALKVRSDNDIDVESIQRWLAAAVAAAG